MNPLFQLKIAVLWMMGASVPLYPFAAPMPEEPMPIAPWPSSANPNVDQKNEYQRQVQYYLQEVDGLLGRIAGAAQRSGGETAQRLEQLGEAIRRKKQAATATLDRLKYAPGAEWDTLTAQLDNAIRDLKDTHYRAIVEMKEEKESYESRLLTQLGQLQSQIEKVKADIRGTSVVSRQKLGVALDDLERERQSALAKLESLRNASGDQWVDIKNDLDRQLHQWKQSYEEILASLKDQETQTQELDHISPPMQTP